MAQSYEFNFKETNICMVFYFWKLKIIVKYYIGKNPLYATGIYRQRMEGVFIKAKQQWLYLP